MTVADLLASLPVEKREDMADFLYSRTPCRYGLRGIAVEDSRPARILFPLSEPDLTTNQHD
jgi:hypothetical protein